MSEDRLDFGVLVATAYVAFVDELRAELAKHGHRDLNRSFGYVARALAEGPLTLRELAARLELTSQGALKIVADLEGAGYLERAVDSRDARARQLSLSRRGKAALEAARKVHARIETRLVARHGKRAVAACRAVLQGLIDERALAGAPPALRSV